MSAASQQQQSFGQSNHSSCQPSSSLQTTAEPEIVPCVQCRQLSFHYKSSNPVLTNINLTVPKGKIYSLLGASGCGKTTLLRLILGQCKPLSGIIKVFGQQPATPESNIPGAGVGYMPQDLALFQLFSIEENLIYYGSLYGLRRSTIKERVDWLIKLLNLPEKKRIVSRLSGGQQRRVSMAVSMIHQPPLLILDEPTVGVDSLLRQKIWDYLDESCTKLGTTVILTTHYTEEAIFSYRVGFIYSGTMLAEGNPQKLMLRYGCKSLEEVFFELCMQKKSLQLAPSTRSPSCSTAKMEPASSQPSVSPSQSKLDIPKIVLEKCEASPDGEVIIHNVILDDLNKDQPDESSLSAPISFPSSDCLEASNDDLPKNPEEVKRLKKHNNNRICIYRFRALFIKNYLFFKRSPHSILLSLIMPAMSAILLCLTIARNLEDIPVAVVNEEQNRSDNSLSKLFIEQIDHATLDLQYYNDLNEAINAIHSNQVTTVMRFQSNFSKYFPKRFVKPERIKETHIKGSNIELYADTSHVVFHLYTYQTLMNAFEKFVKVFGQMIGFNPRYFNTLQIEELIYGTMIPRYYEYFLPGCGILAIHSISMLVATFGLIKERMEGHLERGFVAGTTTEELMLSNILFLLLPIISMDLVIIFISFYVFQLASEGSLLHIFIMNFVSGFQGACIGIVISIVCRSASTAMICAFSIEMPLAFSSGCLWPTESYSKSVYNILIWNPFTLPIMSTRHIYSRGWPLLHIEVLKGLLYSISLTFLILLFGLIYFRKFK